MLVPEIMFMIVTTMLIIILATCNANATNETINNNVSMFPTILVFGDSTVDTGNNNYINTIVRANFHPYGCNFPGRNATGRFSNGKLIPDFIASLMGIKDTVPPYLDPHLSDSEILTGVCFASAGSGYDNLTDLVTSTLSVAKQADMLRSYMARLSRIVGKEKAAKIVGEALVIVSSGTNDFDLNLYDSPSPRDKLGVEGYQNFILSGVHNFIQELYEIGCQRIMVLGVPPIGCLPIQMTMAMQKQKERRCIDKQNSDSKEYNHKLKKSLMDIQSNLTGSLIFYVDIYEALFDMATNPQKYGLKETTRGCCGTGEMEVSYLCNPLTPTCSNPNHFLFWDGIHPSQVAYFVELYNLGCQKTSVGGLAPMGCLPIVMTKKLRKGIFRTCIERHNKDTLLYNEKLKKLVPVIEASLPGSKIVYKNVYDPMMDMIQNPPNTGLRKRRKDVAQQGILKRVTCAIPNLSYVRIHPSLATSNHIARAAESTIAKLYDA